MINPLKFVEAMKEAQIEAHRLAKEKGWYDAPVRTPLENLMLIVSEVAEAAEEIRKGTPPVYQVNSMEEVEEDAEYWKIKRKFEGQAIELADVIIRILDYAEHQGFNIGETIIMKHEYNKTRPYRHGKKI